MTSTSRVARSSLGAVALTAVAALGLAGCAADKPAATSTASAGGSASASGSAAAPALITPGKLTVCTHLSYAPFQLKKEGKVVGFDVDLMDQVAKDMGLTQEIVDIPFEQIWSGTAFKAKKCDAGAAGMTITPKRQESVLFAKPYFDATQALLVKKGSNIKTLADLKGKKLGVQTETTGQSYAADKESENGYTSVVFDDLPLSLTALKAGNVDAVINDNGVLYDYVKTNAELEVVTEFNTGEQYGVAVDKSNPGLAAAFDKTYDRIKGDGTYTSIYKTWFGTEPKSIP